MRTACFAFLIIGGVGLVSGCGAGGGPGAGASTAGASFGGAGAAGGSTSGGGSAATGGSAQGGNATGGSTGTGGSSATGGTAGTGGSNATGGSGDTGGIRILVEPDGQKGQELVDAILAAKVSVHMTMYLLTSTEVINALISQHRAGLQVRVVLDQNLPSGSNQTVYSQLSSAGVAVHWAPSQFTYTHEKCVILDNKEAWIMTMNATYSAPIYNREYLAIDDRPSDVAEAESVFEGDFANQPPGSVTGPLLVAPINATSKIVSLIGSAKKTIDIEAEEFSDYHTADAISAAAQAGVRVHVVLSNSSPYPSQTAAVSQIKAAGASVVSLAKPYVHAKSLVVDGTTAYVGSENFSTGSLQYNRELGVIFSTPAEVQKVLTTTNSDFSAGTPE